MKVSYEFSPKSLRKGVQAHMLHRHIISTFLLPLLGVIFFLYGLNQIFGKQPPNTSLGVILFLLGAFYLILSKRRVSSTAKNAFKANPNERIVSLDVSDGLLVFIDGENTAASPYSSYVDYRVCKGGMLLYPQKNMFLWIPDNAEIEGGTWQDFTDHVSSKITRKI